FGGSQQLRDGSMVAERGLGCRMREAAHFLRELGNARQEGLVVVGQRLKCEGNSGARLGESRFIEFGLVRFVSGQRVAGTCRVKEFERRGIDRISAGVHTLRSSSVEGESGRDEQ